MGGIDLADSFFATIFLAVGFLMTGFLGVAFWVVGFSVDGFLDAALGDLVELVEDPDFLRMIFDCLGLPEVFGAELALLASLDLLDVAFPAEEDEAIALVPGDFAVFLGGEEVLFLDEGTGVSESVAVEERALRKALRFFFGLQAIRLAPVCLENREFSTEFW